MLILKVISFLLLMIITLVCQVWTYESFADFPLSVSYGDTMIHATLTDLSSSKKYFLEEYIRATGYTNGKISISSSVFSSPIDVHYGSSSTFQRLVIQDYDCDLFTYKTKWDKKITDITKPLLNHILLVGPSLIYRLKNKAFTWKTGYNAEIRGTTMKSAYAIIGSKKLNVTVFYRDIFPSDIGISQPSRIKFYGNDPSDYSSTVKQTFILDIYLQKNIDEDLSNMVNPKPGIGCPIFFPSSSDSKEFSNLLLVRDSVHYISIENVNGPTKSATRNEVHADEANQLLSLKTTSQGITTEAIYDYLLGIIYVLRKNDCLISPMGLSSLGIRTVDSYKPLRVISLIQPPKTQRYLGQTWFENRPGFGTDVWESIVYNGTTSSGSKYDKVVTTIYTVDSKNGDTSSGMIPVGKTIHAYNKGSSGSYSLVEMTTIEYYDFGQEITKEKYADRFQIVDCYPEPENRKTLAITLNCKSGNCNRAAQKYFYSFPDELRSAIINIGTISGGRIGDIDIAFDSNTTIAYVTFLNFPDVSTGFKSSFLYLSPDIFKGLSRSTAKSATDCLKQNANMATTFEAVAYCSEDRTCTRIGKIDSLVEDKSKGTGCTVFHIPLRNLYRYNSEAPLDKIQEELKDRGLGVYFYDGNSLVQYTVGRVDEVIEPQIKSRSLFKIENFDSKFVEDGTSTIMATSATNFGDCFRACSHFDEDDCETFSFCQWQNDKIECLLSTSVYANVTDKRVYDAGCHIYRKNRLEDYVQIKNRQFINPTSIATEYWLDDCADLCSQSDECFSFQTCQGTCRFGGYYTDSSTRYSENCNIFIPKLASKFASTGKKIVTEIYHTEFSLTLDQCAALCYDIGSNDGDCSSFNFCPKGSTASSCNLSKFSVKNSSTKTIDSNVCTNYELIPDKTKDKTKQSVNQDNSTNNGTSGAEAFGIIVLFIAVGFVVGLTGPFVYEKSKILINKATSPGSDSFTWNRQLNEETEEEQSVI